MNDDPWEVSESRSFAGIFAQVQQAIMDGLISKAVPVVTERGPVVAGSFRNLVRSLHTLPRPLRGYGWLDLVVAIRMVVARENELILPAGCGVIGESRFANEWSELRLKRETVKALFGLAEEGTRDSLPARAAGESGSRAA